MSDERLAAEIRAAFDSTHVPSPGLEDRVVSAVPWDRSPDHSTSMPRLAGAFAATVALLAVVVLIAPTILTRLNLQFPGLLTSEPPAYSLAAVSGQSVFIVQRGGPTAPGKVAGNLLLQSSDGGRTWVKRLQFEGVYGGSQVFGATGYVWSIDMQATGCDGAGQLCTPPSYAFSLYSTVDGGATWNAHPSPGFPVEDAFFLDALRGWAVSGSPEMGLGSEVLYSTADGGRSWTRVGALPTAVPMSYTFGVGVYRVTFSRQADGTLRGWFVGATQLYTSTDSGVSWKPVPLGVPAAVAGWTSTPSQPSFSGLEGILPIAYRDPKGPDNATPNRIYVYVSHDGGSTWSDPRSAPAGFAPVGDDLSFTILDTEHLWMTSLSLSAGDNVQAAPAVARTSDGGLTWIVAGHTPRILQMAFADATRGYGLDVSGPNNTNGIVSTSDGGATWQRVYVPVFASD